MNRHLGVLVGLVLGSYVSLGLAQDAQPPSSIPPIVQTDELNQDMIEAVKAIRQRLGGSIAEQFKDLGTEGSSKKEAEHEFDRELNRLATHAFRNAKVGSTTQVPQILRPVSGQIQSSPPRIGRQTPVDGPRFQQKSPPPNAVPVGYPVKRSTSTDLLRDAARRLETMAADMEAANLYQEADEIRDQARKFWLKARGIKNNSN